jgi:acyl-CoA thioester hydrolase
VSESKQIESVQPTSGALQKAPLFVSGSWFEYPVRAHPHHTDYSGAVWHGAYVAWMEEARVECLRAIGINYAELVALGCELPVVDVSVRYHRSLRMGMEAIVKARMTEVDGVRINWDYQIQSPDGQELYLTARVILVAVDREKGKIMRRLPAAVQDAFAKLAGSSQV